MTPGCYDAVCSEDKKKIIVTVKNISKECTVDNQALTFSSP